ncbi:HDIG domain-containing protein [Marinitoga hydrogenitolerans DSM 16785]|uniref:HDIG domain-containing protein n=1 Tax=Marinitoga hydrogenitolerans (strain DSM 16785 / JCM 12826 / AT1271) TaxID=1122195 RepID=A0A1M4TB31_MARH1|nr:HD-GYP domain-containing protein [Marinitoga hydrogenitolerans]SHE41640.1 HDIG domain-containing protein [Marinitoga hydrogenitolerans DSM 16785]
MKKDTLIVAVVFFNITIFGNNIDKTISFQNGIFYYILLFLLVVTSIIITLFIDRKTLKKKYLEKENELKGLNLDLDSANKELEDSYKKIEKLNSSIIKILELSSFFAAPKLMEKDFEKKVLDLAIEIIEPAKNGSIFLFNDDNAKMVYARGYDYNKINELKLKKQDLIVPEKSKIIKEIHNVNKYRMSEDLFNEFHKLGGNLKETLITPIIFNSETFGIITLDIHKNESTKRFEDYHTKIMDYFGKTFAGFLKMLNFIKQEGKFHKDIALTLVKALEYYDDYTRGHSERVANWASLVAEKMNMDKEKIERIYWAGVLHDIGKIFIPQTILNKSGRLTPEEYEKIKLHPVKGEELIDKVEEMADISKIIRHHHERWDGTGYPDGLLRENIPLESRILAVADSFDAMISKRPYKKPLTKKEAIFELKRLSMKQFDGKVVSAFIEIIEKEDI